MFLFLNALKSIILRFNILNEWKNETLFLFLFLKKHIEWVGDTWHNKKKTKKNSAIFSIVWIILCKIMFRFSSCLFTEQSRIESREIQRRLLVCKSIESDFTIWQSQFERTTPFCERFAEDIQNWHLLPHIWI